MVGMEPKLLKLLFRMIESTLKSIDFIYFEEKKTHKSPREKNIKEMLISLTFRGQG